MQQERLYEQEPYEEGYRQYMPAQEKPDLEPEQSVPPQPQWSAAPFVNTSYAGAKFVNESGNLAAGACYIGFWVTGLLFLLFGHKSRLVRFHAMQALLFFGGVNVLYIVLISIITQQIPFIYGFAIFFFVVMNVIACVAWFVGMCSAFAGKYTKLPFVGDFVERYVNRDSLLK